MIRRMGGSRVLRGRGLVNFEDGDGDGGRNKLSLSTSGWINATIAKDGALLAAPLSWTY